MGRRIFNDIVRLAIGLGWVVVALAGCEAELGPSTPVDGGDAVAPPDARVTPVEPPDARRPDALTSDVLPPDLADVAVDGFYYARMSRTG